MKKYIVRMVCRGMPWEPEEFVFMNVLAENEEEAKEAVQDQMCHSIAVNEVEEWP